MRQLSRGFIRLQALRDSAGNLNDRAQLLRPAIQSTGFFDLQYVKDRRHEPNDEKGDHSQKSPGQWNIAKTVHASAFIDKTMPNILERS